MATGTRSRDGHRLTAGRRFLLVVVALAVILSSAAVLIPEAVSADTTLDTATFDTGATTNVAGVTWAGCWRSELGNEEPGAVDMRPQSPCPGGSTGTANNGPRYAVTAGDVITATAYAQSLSGGGTYWRLCSSASSSGSSPTCSGPTTNLSTTGFEFRSIQHTVAAGHAFVFIQSTYSVLIDDIVIVKEGAEPTPTPTPAPTAGPTATPDAFPWDDECVNDAPTGPPPPGYDFPPLCDDSNRHAAEADISQEQAFDRCVGATDEFVTWGPSDWVVVSCQDWNELDGYWFGDQWSDDNHPELHEDNRGANLASSWYVGHMVDGGVFTVEGITAPYGNAAQTWCWPGNDQCFNNDGSLKNLVSDLGASATGMDENNWPPERMRGRARIVASVVNSGGQTDYVCVQWPGHNQVETYAAGDASDAYYSADSWRCPIPAGTDGAVFLRSRVFGLAERFDSPVPNDTLTHQRYQLSMHYAVLEDAGHWQGEWEGDWSWETCADTSATAACSLDIADMWEDDAYQAPATAWDLPDDPGPVEGIPPDEDPGYCPLSGEAKPGCVPLANCGTLDVVCAVGNLGSMLLNILVDLFMPGDALGDAIADLGDAFNERAPFGWFLDLYNGITGALTAPASTLTIPNLCVGSSCVTVSPYTFTAGVAPYRGLIFAGVAFVMLLGCFHTVMGAVGHVRAPKQLEMGL